MSMEKAMAALNAATSNTPAAQAPEMPVNMANGGANEKVEEPIQATQEVKENADSGSKQDGDGVVEAASQSTAETTSTPKIEEPKKDETPISTKFAALAKKEKMLVKQQNDMKAKEAAIAAKEAEIAAREAKIKESEELWSKDVFKALESKGLSYNKLTEMMLRGELITEKEPEDPVALAKKEIEQFRKEFEEREKREADARKKAEEDARIAREKELEEAYSQYRQEVNSYTTENSDQYELINLYGQQDLVIDTVQTYYDKHKRVLSVKEASDMVEKYLYDEAQKALKSKKFSKKEEPAKKSVSENIVEKKDTEKKVAPVKTLTNNLQPTMSSVLPAATDSERMKRALEALNNNSR